MGNPTQRTEDSGVSAYTYNNLNELLTGSWSGTLSTFGWTQTADLDHVQVETGQQSKPADVFQQGEFTAKGFDAPAGDNTFTVTRVATDQTTTQQQTTVTRPADQTQYQHDANGQPTPLLRRRRPTRARVAGERSERPQGAATPMLTYDNLWTYAWNNENRLVAVEKSGAGVPPANRLAAAEKSGAGVPPANRLAAAEKSGAGVPPANRLAAAEKSGAGVPPANRLRLEFVYDHQGRRRTKKVFARDDPTQSWTHTYLYDQWNVIADQVHDSSFYLWGLYLSNTLQGAVGVGGLLAAYTPDGNWFYAYDVET